MKARYVLIKSDDDTGRERLVAEFYYGPRAEQVRDKLQRTADGCGSAVTYRVIEEVRRPLAVLRRRVTA